jgi:cytochrome c-type biogenesis protein CcmH
MVRKARGLIFFEAKVIIGMNFKQFRPATVAFVVAAASLAGVVLMRNAPQASGGAAPAAEQAPVESHDAAQWRKTGSACFDANDYACAVDAYQKAVAIAPDDAGAWSALGEARVMASQHDPMPAPALDAFRRAVQLAPKDPRARYFLAVNKDLGGDHKGAIADWLALLGETAPGMPWEKDLRRTIEQVGKINRIDVAARLAAIRQPRAEPGVPGPSGEDLAAATAIPPSQQRTMAEAMVGKLEARLATDPHNAEGWIMLMRSRINLDQRDRAQAALARALQVDAADAAQIRAGAGQLGLTHAP